MPSLSLTDAVQVFPCPHCGETINTSVLHSPFCTTPIDHAAAEAAATATSRVSQACSDASYLKVMVFALIPFIFLIFLPFFSLAGVVGFWFLKVAIPFMLVRWWVRFSSIQTTDPDYPRARRTVLIVGIVWLLVFGLTFKVR